MSQGHPLVGIWDFVIPLALVIWPSSLFPALLRLVLPVIRLVFGFFRPLQADGSAGVELGEYLRRDVILAVGEQHDGGAGCGLRGGVYHQRVPAGLRFGIAQFAVAYKN